MINMILKVIINYINSNLLALKNVSKLNQPQSHGNYVS